MTPLSRWTTVLWPFLLIPSVGVTQSDSCYSKKEQFKWSAELPNEIEQMTTSVVALCENQGQWTWTQNHQGRLAVRVRGTVHMDSALQSYAKDIQKQDKGFRDIEIQIFKTPEESSAVAYGGYCQLDAKNKSAPCYFVKASQCKAIRDFESKHNRAFVNLTAKNISSWLKSGKKEKIDETLNTVATDFKKLSPELFSDETLHQKYQDIVNSMVPEIPMAEKLRGSRFSFSKTESLNKKMAALMTQEPWTLETYRQWSDLFGKASRACAKIPESPAAMTPRQQIKTNSHTR